MSDDAARRERALKWANARCVEPDFGRCGGWGIEVLDAHLAGAREEAALAMDQPHTTSCGHTWMMRHTACPECFVALRAENVALRERLLEFRDIVLNQRGALSENGMTSEQVNDVLGEFDNLFPEEL